MPEKSIAILMSGLIREDVSIILRNIANIYKQFSHLVIVDIFFHTWESTEKYSYPPESLELIKSVVKEVIVRPFPKELSPEYYLPMENSEKYSYNVFCLFLAISQLCELIDNKNYDHVCRIRNDLYIDADFGHLLKLLEQNRTHYIAPIILWMKGDGINDHFAITNKENFLKVFRTDEEKLKIDFKAMHECPEKILLYKLLINNLRYSIFLPYNYVLKNSYMVKDEGIVINNLNSYMHNYVRNNLDIKILES